MRRSYLPTGLVVVQVHKAFGIAGVRFLRIQELTCEPHAEAKVHATSTPFPRGTPEPRVQGPRVVSIAPANGYVATATRVHQRVRNAGADHSVHVRRFPARCKHNETHKLVRGGSSQGRHFRFFSLRSPNILEGQIFPLPGKFRKWHQYLFV